MTIEEQFNEVLEGSEYTWKELSLLDLEADALTKEEFDSLAIPSMMYRIY